MYQSWLCSSKDNSEEVEKTFKKHASWMEDFIQKITVDDAPLNSYFTKAPEFVDPTDPSKGETGNMFLQ